MSLLTESMEDCVIINKQITDDGYGGYTTNYTEGASFKAAIRFDSSIQARTAEKAGVTSLYTVVTPKSLILQYHDVFRRIEDNKIFRVTSDGDDKKTPNSATLNMREVTAEEWSLNSE